MLASVRKHINTNKFLNLNNYLPLGLILRMNPFTLKNKIDRVLSPPFVMIDIIILNFTTKTYQCYLEDFLTLDR
jgi:hypothetical protein